MKIYANQQIKQVKEIAIIFRVDTDFLCNLGAILPNVRNFKESSGNLNFIKFSQVQNKIISLREQQVILDSDVAELYGVETKRINEAVKNNPEKFPNGYVLLVQSTERQKLVENFDFKLERTVKSNAD